MCSSEWSRLSPVFSWKFVCYSYPLQHDSTLKQTFHSKVFFEKWNGNEKPKKISQTRQLGKDKWYNQMGQVGTSWNTWDKCDKEKGVFRSSWDKWDKEKGVFRSSWDKWDKDKGSVHLNHSTCPKRDYKAVKSSKNRRLFPGAYLVLRLEIILDLPFGFPINNIISLS